MDYIISGIQQMGIGVRDAEKAWAWYRKYFGLDIPIFKEEAEAGLMLPYTGGQPRKRYAILAINLQGGGGFEIWQYKSREPQPPKFTVQIGDYGIFATKIKCFDVEKTYQFFQSEELNLLSPVYNASHGQLFFFVADPFGNIFQVIESDDWFQKGNKVATGGVYGAIIGVSNIEKSLPLYRNILGYDEKIYDETGVFEGYKGLPGGKLELRRVLLKHSQPREGAFSKMLGSSELELIQVLDRKPRKIYEDRMWGDLGFIHLCYDIRDMEALKKKCESEGFPFTVDSAGSFDMGEAAGRFTYIEDPDGTLIEFVETHKMPIAKKLGWYLNLSNRDARKPLPDWILKALSLNRKKD